MGTAVTQEFFYLHERLSDCLVVVSGAGAVKYANPAAQDRALVTGGLLHPAFAVFLARCSADARVSFPLTVSLKPDGADAAADPIVVALSPVAEGDLAVIVCSPQQGVRWDDVGRRLVGQLVHDVSGGATRAANAPAVPSARVVKSANRVAPAPSVSAEPGIIGLRSALLENFARDLSHSRADRDALAAALQESYREIVVRLAKAAALKDLDTSNHMQRVGALAELLGRLYGLPPRFCTLLRDAAPMHDIGKIGIPDELLSKREPLSRADWVIMKQHTTVGAELLSGTGIELLDLAAEVALNHHECFDGSGYPRRLAGESIPISGRIVAVVDCFDASTTDRVYRQALTYDQALASLRRSAGHSLDARMVALLLDNADRFIALQREVDLEYE